MMVQLNGIVLTTGRPLSEIILDADEKKAEDIEADVIDVSCADSKESQTAENHKECCTVIENHGNESEKGGIEMIIEDIDFEFKKNKAGRWQIKFSVSALNNLTDDQKAFWENEIITYDYVMYRSVERKESFVVVRHAQGRSRIAWTNQKKTGVVVFFPQVNNMLTDPMLNEGKATGTIHVIHKDEDLVIEFDFDEPVNR